MKKEDKTAKALRSAYRKYTKDDYETLNKDHFKGATSYEENRKRYVDAVREAKKRDPMGMQNIQDRNTDAKLAVLNAIDFERDAYAQDPISQKAFEDLQYKVTLPLGHIDSEGAAFTLPGSALGATIRGNDHPNKGSVRLASGVTLPKLQNGRLGTVGTLRHEGHHSVSRNTPHNEVYALDRMYQMTNKDNDRAIPDEYRRNPTKSELLGLMLDAKRKATKYGLGDPEAIPKGLDEVAEWGEATKIPSKEQLKMLKSAKEYELSGRRLHRDLPNQGWWDTFFGLKK